MSISNLSPQQLRKAADLLEKIEALQQQYNDLLGLEVPTPGRYAACRSRKGWKEEKKAQPSSYRHHPGRSSEAHGKAEQGSSNQGRTGNRATEAQHECCCQGQAEAV